MERKLQSMNVRSLLAAYDKKRILSIKKLNFIGVDDLDVYNITAPFHSSNREYIAGRVEKRDNELNSKLMFFIKKNNAWVLDKKAPVFNLQDPFVSIINNEIIFGGVEIIIEKEIINYFTVFFRGKDIYTLKKFAQGPNGMKDIRLVSLSNGNFGLFTRPQGSIGGRGRIGFMNITSLENLSKLKNEDYFAAPLLPGDFKDEEWLGVNAAYILKNGKIGILGHIACYTKDACKNYYPITFMFNSKINTIVGMKIIATRNDFPKGQSKAETLKNVLFAGGLVRNNDGTATLYTGAGDAESYEVKMIDPFLEYELD